MPFAKIKVISVKFVQLFCTNQSQFNLNIKLITSLLSYLCIIVIRDKGYGIWRETIFDILGKNDISIRRNELFLKELYIFVSKKRSNWFIFPWINYFIKQKWPRMTLSLLYRYSTDIIDFVSLSIKKTLKLLKTELENFI